MINHWNNGKLRDTWSSKLLSKEDIFTSLCQVSSHHFSTILSISGKDHWEESVFAELDCSWSLLDVLQILIVCVHWVLVVVLQEKVSFSLTNTKEFVWVCVWLEECEHWIIMSKDEWCVFSSPIHSLRISWVFNVRVNFDIERISVNCDKILKFVWWLSKSGLTSRFAFLLY